MHSRLPKVLQPLAGQPLLAHVLELARSLEPAAICVVYGHGGEQVREYFAGDEAARATAAAGSLVLQWVRQSEQRGTGHALEQAMPVVPDEHRVLVLYGDVPLLRRETLRELMAAAGARGVALLTALLTDPSGYGRVIRDRGGRIRRIVEHRDATSAERTVHEINTGVLLAPARALRRWLRALRPRNEQGEYYLTDVVAMAARERLAVHPLLAADSAEVVGVNDRLQLAEAEAEYRRRRARELMAGGVTLIDPARLDVRGPVEVETDVLLDVNVVLEGPVRLGAGVRIGPNCVVRNASIGARTVLHANCVVQDADIGADCSIGPFARLRPGARLADAVHAGNFVEIKNSEIGPGSKVNHLSYVGDTTVGSGVNVGAGAITCNYDGAAKWRTQIGDGAFIGSGSMLVAPVAIGAGATIGAGSTITADAPAGKLTLARSRQVTVEEWQRRRKPPQS
jgi:bifunctional UDP-N-acetylglucosamine pyrophosphorylase / glucosamine-1-phosphate N-acetyltransferase